MTPYEQRITIATACGWTKEEALRGFKTVPRHSEGLVYQQVSDKLPDYLNDLNAMHEAEDHLELWQHAIFRDELAKLVAPHHCWERAAYHMLRPYVSATAAKRAEAFLKALSLWTLNQ